MDTQNSLPAPLRGQTPHSSGGDVQELALCHHSSLGMFYKSFISLSLPVAGKSCLWMSIIGPLLHGSQSGNSITAQDTSHEQFGHLNLSLFLEKGCIPFLSHHQAAKFNQIPEPSTSQKIHQKRGKEISKGSPCAKSSSSSGMQPQNSRLQLQPGLVPGFVLAGTRSSPEPAAAPGMEHKNTWKKDLNPEERSQKTAGMLCKSIPCHGSGLPLVAGIPRDWIRALAARSRF